MGDYAGTVVCDALKTHEAGARGNAGIVLAGCWAHVFRKFEEAGPPPEPPRPQDIKMRLKGGRTGVRAITCTGLELRSLMQPFDLEVFYADSGWHPRIPTVG